MGNKSPVGGSPLSKTIYYAPKDKNTIYIIVHDSLCISTDKDSLVKIQGEHFVYTAKNQ